MDEKLKVGNIVQLNSGSPNMVITYLNESSDETGDPDDIIFCDCQYYFEGDFQEIKDMDSRTLKKV